MANSILKWCKSKIINGYKHINVNAEDLAGARSDTETLLRTYEDLPLTPSPATATAHSKGTSRGGGGGGGGASTRNTSRAEEVSCNVSVSAGVKERQEFSFTLYDLDGPERTAKDDIAGLVRTIYDAVGSSLSMPPCGSRTIRVKLTVTPEHKEQHSFDTPRSCESHMRQRSAEGDHCDATSQCNHRKHRVHRRCPSIQRQELIEIIEANMAKNNLHYRSRPPSHCHGCTAAHLQNQRRRRKACCCRIPVGPPVTDTPTPEASPRQYHVHTHNYPSPESASLNHWNAQHHRSKSHDYSPGVPPLFYCLPERTHEPTAPHNTPSRRAHSPRSYRMYTRHQRHHRSRSCDAASDVVYGCSPKNRCKTNTPRSCRSRRDAAKDPSAQPAPPNTSLLECSRGFPNLLGLHQKQQRKDIEHARAMAQVIDWLENRNLLQSSPRQAGGAACSVHQHFHHHYHHYSPSSSSPLPS